LKILVINVSLRPNPTRIFLPIGLGYVVSAMKRGGFEFDLLDLDAQPLSAAETREYLQTHRYDVVAMGCIVTGYRQVKWLAGTIKEAFPDTVIVVGNTVAQSIPQLLLTRTGADVAVMGEGDETIVELLTRLRNSRNLEGIRGICYLQEGEVRVNPPRPVIPNLDTIPIPYWDLFEVEAYIQNLSKSIDEPLPPIPKESIRAMTINTARGCPYNCTFCYHTFRGQRYRWRAADSIIQEIRHYRERYGINHLTFLDELTFFSLKQVAEFADALLASGLQVYWNADCRSGLFYKDEHLDIAHKLRQGGCLSLSYSLESANPEILKWMNKKVGPEAFSRQVEILRGAGIASLTSIVIGYPNETPETIKSTIDCCIANGIYPSTGYLLPQPGTPMYDYALKQGYIQDEEDYLLRLGDRQDLRLNLTGMSDLELEETTQRELARCSRELALGLNDGGLLKTGYYRSPEVRKPETI
jgi:anaerobic magnesium-protoporphyrin IX monomethyl ester cyclase